MKKLFEIIGGWITVMVDFFYPPFRKYVTLQFFRYGVTGAANMAFDWVLYFITFHFILEKQMLHLGFVTLSSHIAAMVLVFPITFISGFLLQKYVTFTSSELRGRVQIVRYLSVVIANLLLNYIGLKLLVDFLHVFPTPSKMIVTIFTTMFSYFSQKKFTFKKVVTPKL
ncbi:MAG: GtrA family protein [Bacteroidales bacterium]|nr:GtrA family protein [Bacteroidales bacterium]